MANESTSTTTNNDWEYPDQGYDAGDPTWIELLGQALEAADGDLNDVATGAINVDTAVSTAGDLSASDDAGWYYIDDEDSYAYWDGGSDPSP